MGNSNLLHGKTLIFLEHENQVRDYLKRFARPDKNAKIIALSPFAIYELDKNNILYSVPEDYYKPEELYLLGIKNFKEAEKVCRILDKYLYKSIPLLPEKEISPASFMFYHLKNIYDSLVLRIFQLSKIFEKEKPDNIIIHETKEYSEGFSNHNPRSLLFDNRESLYSRLLSLKGWKTKITFLPFVLQPEGSFPEEGSLKKIENKFKLFLQLHPALFNLVSDLKKKGLSGILKSGEESDNFYPIILFGGTYNWDNCMNKFQSYGFHPIISMRDNLEFWVSRSSFSTNHNKLFSGLKSDKEFRKFFVWSNNIDFFPMFESRLIYILKCMVPACMESYKRTDQMIEKYNPKLFLASGFPTCTSKSAATAAKNKNIPVVSWQHGAYGYMDQSMIPYNDFFSPGTHFVFGEGVAEKYRELARSLGTSLIPVGFSSLDKIEKSNLSGKDFPGIDKNKKTILYVTTSFYQNHLYVAIPPIFSDNFFWRTQKSIADVLSRHNGYNIVIKTHDQVACRETPLRSYMKKKKAGNFIFVRNEHSFTELIPFVDIFIIDCPSTTLLEALTTSKHIFTLTSYFKIDKNAENLLKKRAFCYSNTSDLTKSLNLFLKSGTLKDTNIDLKNKEFLKSYGTHLDDGKSVERALDFLKNTISRKKSS